MINMNPLPSNSHCVILGCYDPFELKNPKTWLDWTIRKITHSRFNHIILLILDCDEQKYFLEANASGVIMSSYNYYVKNNPKRKFFICHDKKIYTRLNIAKAKFLLGLSYNFNILLKMLKFKIYHKLFGPQYFLTKKFSNRKKNYEYFSFQYIGIICNMENPWLLSGKDFEEKFNIVKFDFNNWDRQILSEKIEIKL